MGELISPTAEAIIHVNEIINIMSNRKADQHRLMLSSKYIDQILLKTQEARGDLFDKAAVLLRGLVTTHGFASGNKQTGFIATIWFLRKNHARIRVKTFKSAERVIRNIRRYDEAELAAWLRTGEIDESKIQ